MLLNTTWRNFIGVRLNADANLITLIAALVTSDQNLTQPYQSPFDWLVYTDIMLLYNFKSLVEKKKKEKERKENQRSGSATKIALIA